jgi:hypothetical protein
LAYDGGDWEAKHRTSARVKAQRVEAGLEAPITMQPGSPGMAPAAMLDPEDEDDPEQEDDDPDEQMDPTEPPLD